MKMVSMQSLILLLVAITTAPVLSHNSAGENGERDEKLIREMSGILKKLSKCFTPLASALPDLPPVTAINKAARGGGSVYVRWGHSACPESAEMVYSGVMGGSHYSTSGGAANILCLPLTPKHTTETFRPVYGTAKLYGVEYETNPDSSNEQDGVCSVCRVPMKTSVMVPATDDCPDGWERQYNGFLMAGKPDGGRVSTEYICVDALRQARAGGDGNRNEGVIYFTEFKCGSLPCPPYETGKLALCAMCSK